MTVVSPSNNGESEACPTVYGIEALTIEDSFIFGFLSDRRTCVRFPERLNACVDTMRGRDANGYLEGCGH